MLSKFWPMTPKDRAKVDLDVAQRDLYEAQADLERAQHQVRFLEAKIQRLTSQAYPDRKKDPQ